MGFPGQALFTLAQQLAQQPQQGQPQANPAQPTPTGVDPLTSSMIQSTQMGQQQFQADAARRAALANQLSQLQQQQASLQPPKTGYEPQFKPMNSFGNVMGDIGKGALLGLSATGPGRAVSEAKYGPGERRYATEAGSIANQIAEIQKQMGSESEAMQAGAGMASKPYNAMARYEVGVMNNQTRQAHDRAVEKLRGELNQIQQDLGNKKITAEQARTKAEILIGQGHDNAIRDVAGINADQRDRDTQVQEVEKEWQSDITGIKSAFGTLFGAAPAPSKTATPAPGPKASGSSPNPRKPNKPSGGVVKWGRDAQGNPIKISQ